MDIYFASRALGEQCNSKAALARRWGPERGALVEQQLTELQALDRLEDYVGLPHVRASSTRETTTLHAGENLVIVLIASEGPAETQRLTVIAIEERAEESWDQ